MTQASWINILFTSSYCRQVKCCRDFIPSTIAWNKLQYPLQNYFELMNNCLLMAKNRPMCKHYTRWTADSKFKWFCQVKGILGLAKKKKKKKNNNNKLKSRISRFYSYKWRKTLYVSFNSIIRVFLYRVCMAPYSLQSPYIKSGPGCRKSGHNYPADKFLSSG